LISTALLAAMALRISVRLLGKPEPNVTAVQSKNAPAR